MRMINPEHIRALLEMINRGPYYQLLSMKVSEIGVGYSKMEVELEQKHLNPFGIVHGGVYSSILDTVAYWAAYCELDENAGCTSLDVSVDFLAMASSGLILAEGRAVKVGRSMCFTEATVRDAQGKLLAKATSKLMVLQGKQTVQQAIDVLGCGTGGDGAAGYGARGSGSGGDGAAGYGARGSGTGGDGAMCHGVTVNGALPPKFLD